MPKVTQIGRIRLWIQAHTCVSLKTEFSQYLNILLCVNVQTEEVIHIIV